MRKPNGVPSVSLFPPVWVFVILALLGGTVAAVRFGDVLGDHANTNTFTAIALLPAVLILAGWFVVLSNFTLWTRLIVSTITMAVLAATVGLVRIDSVSGELIPRFKWRWAPAHDALLPIPATPKADYPVDLVTTTDYDFAQFLGPNRVGKVEGIRLSPDWTAHPPRLVWRQPIGAGWSSFSAVNGFAVTMEQRGPSELVSCYEVKTGKLLWTHGVSARHHTTLGGTGPRGTPTIHEGKVYALGATGYFHCLDGATGNELWHDDLLARCGVTPEEDLDAVAWGRANSPLIVDQRVIIPLGGPDKGPCTSLIAFDKETGSVAWQGGNSQISYSSPTLATICGKQQILIVNEADIAGHDPNTGERLWSYPWKGSTSGDASAAQPMVVRDDRILLTKGYDGGSLLLQLVCDERQFHASEVWRRNRLLRTKFTNVIIHRNHAYGLSDGILECVDLARGERTWKRGRYSHGQLLGVGDHLLVQTESGPVALVEAKPDRFRELGSFPALDGQTWNNLCLHGKYLLVRNAEEAACYELPLLE